MNATVKGGPLTRLIMNDRAGRRLLGVLLAISILVPLSNLLMPEGSIFHVSTFTMTLLGKYLCYALLAVAVDLIWGYCGILSLGHGAFFALVSWGNVLPLKSADPV